MNELDQKNDLENPEKTKLQDFTKLLKADLANFGENNNEKTAINNQTSEVNPDFDLTARDILDLIGDDNIKAFLNFPEKGAAQLALKVIPEKDRGRFKIGAKDDNKFADMKLRLANKILEKYGSDLNVKVSPEIALIAITGFSTAMVFTQTRVEANRFIHDLALLEEKKS